MRDECAASAVRDHETFPLKHADSLTQGHAADTVCVTEYPLWRQRISSGQGCLLEHGSATRCDLQISGNTGAFVYANGFETLSRSVLHTSTISRRDSKCIDRWIRLCLY